MIVDWQYEPIKGSLLHIDLKRIAMDKKLAGRRADRAQGRACWREDRGRHSRADCCVKWKWSACPATFRPQIEVDVSELVFGKVMRVSDLPKSDKTQVRHRREPAGGPRHHGEGRSGGGSGSCGAEAAATPAEPEVIKKGKQETEEEGAEAACEAEKGEKKEKK